MKVFVASNQVDIAGGGGSDDDDDFEDFSSDEEEQPKLKKKGSKGESIMEQIKTKKKLAKQIKEQERDEIIVNTCEIDPDDKEYAALDSDNEQSKDDIDTIQEVTNSKNKQLVNGVDPAIDDTLEPPTVTIATVKPDHDTIDSGDEEDGDETSGYVIADEIDVDNDWMKDKKKKKKKKKRTEMKITRMT